MSQLDSKVKILIVDDHPMVREGLRLRISQFSDMTVCGEAASEDEAYATALETNPDLAIIDISLKSGHGLTLINRLHVSLPKLKILVSSGFQESLYAVRALRAGASGYLNKQESGEKVIEAIRVVLRGDLFVSKEISEKLIAESLGRSVGGANPIDMLSDRELQIFRMIGSGKTSGAIANELLLSPHTIDTHRENIKRKLGLKNASELNRMAVQFLLENN